MTPSREHNNFGFVMLSQLTSPIVSWWHSAPLATNTPGPIPQEWHFFTKERWTSDARYKPRQQGIKHQLSGSFRLISWNVNADARYPKLRMSALLQAIKTTGSADVNFLQEVSYEALDALLDDPWVRRNWYTSDANNSSFRGRI
jgi:tyrosyl-DNA phosphodiesterase 2